MQYIPIKTRIMQPPKDDLFEILEESLTDVQENDVIAISSKVVAIHEGRCVPIENQDKETLVRQESDMTIPRPYWNTPLTVRHHAFVGAAGIDESNADGHYVYLPEDPFRSAKKIWSYLKEKHTVKNIGVLISDSHSTPMRRGATGISIGWWGFEPIINHVGEDDLFGREMKIEVTNLVDGMASGANLVMGETNECCPIVVLRDMPKLTFTDENTKDKLMVPFEEDTFRTLYERFLS